MENEIERIGVFLKKSVIPKYSNIKQITVSRFKFYQTKILVLNHWDGKRILTIEDNLEIRAYIFNIIKMIGFDKKYDVTIQFIRVELCESKPNY